MVQFLFIIAVFVIIRNILNVSQNKVTKVVHCKKTHTWVYDKDKKLKCSVCNKWPGD